MPEPELIAFTWKDATLWLGGVLFTVGGVGARFFHKVQVNRFERSEKRIEKVEEKIRICATREELKETTDDLKLELKELRQEQTDRHSQLVQLIIKSREGG